MIALLLKYWPQILGAALALGLILMIAHWRSEAAKVEGLENQITTLYAQLESERAKIKANQQLTREVSQNYEDAINKRNADLKRLQNRPARCVPVTATAGSGDAANGGSQPDTANGITDSKLYDFASDCETDRIKVVTLQNFISKVWDNNTTGE